MPSCKLQTKSPRPPGLELCATKKKKSDGLGCGVLRLEVALGACLDGLLIEIRVGVHLEDALVQLLRLGGETP